MGYPVTWLLKLSSVASSAFSKHWSGRQISFYPSPTHKSSPMSISLTSLSLVFQLCFFQVSNHPAISFSTAHTSVYNYISGHLSFWGKCTRTCIPQISACWDFASLLYFTDIPEGLWCCRCLVSYNSHNVIQILVFCSSVETIIISKISQTLHEDMDVVWERQYSRGRWRKDFSYFFSLTLKSKTEKRWKWYRIKKNRKLNTS